MPVAGGRDRALARGGATHQRAVRVAAIAGDADRKQAMTATAGFLAERDVHGVGAAGRSAWTSRPNRGTRETTASACWSPRASRGSGGSVRALTLGPTQPTRSRTVAPAKRPWTVARPWTHRTRPQPLGNLAKNARFPHRPPQSSFSLNKTGSERFVDRPSRFLRFYVVGNKDRRFLDGEWGHHAASGASSASYAATLACHSRR